MHPIVKSHLKKFIEDYAITSTKEDDQFERFSNFCLASQITATSFDVEQITTGKGDDGIDGIAVVINEEIITSTNEAEDIFELPKRQNEVSLVFVQSKTSEHFDLAEFSRFKDSVKRFVTKNDNCYPDVVLKSNHEIFHDALLQNVPKIKNGKPNINVYFVATGIFRFPEDLVRAKDEFEIDLTELGYFSRIEVKFIDRDQLIKLWMQTYEASEAKLSLYSSAELPLIEGINEAYLAVVKAEDYVKQLLLNEDGKLKVQVFVENVRAYLGDDNPINKQIAGTLKSKATSSRFPVLNNGITIVSPDIQIQGKTLHLKDYQIVNGCQTSNVLYENLDCLGETMVNIKFVETQQEDVFAELVQATNSQTHVESNQFIALKPIIKRIEQYFNSVEGDNRLYFERREKQYVGHGIAATRIFSLSSAIRCVAAMYCGRPDLASRYPKNIYGELGSKIFADDLNEVVYYASCLAFYRLNILLSNKVLSSNMNQFKWHILAIVRMLISEKKLDLNLNSKDAKRSAESVISALEKHGETSTSYFIKAQDICNQLNDVTSDMIKREKVLKDIIEIMKLTK